jgi:CubicO group peptidase (beta-lactamase class C family)
MTRKINSIVLILLTVFVQFGHAQKKPVVVYYPEPGQWLTKKPEELGMTAEGIKAAVDFAVQRESKNSKNLEVAHYQGFGREPFGDGIGPFSERGPATGMIIRNGYIVGQWGEPQRVDMTFSVTKSFLSTVVGLAYDNGLIRNVNDTVYKQMAPIQIYDPMGEPSKASGYGSDDLVRLFDTPHNKTITWNHLLRQVSDWEGTLWGKPEWADRPGDKPAEWTTRPRKKPGEAYEYNDVRVNVLALAALNVWRKPLPEVLREKIMDPIGASTTWRWFGYENSWVVIDGRIMQAVGGGGHWGGGMFIDAHDMARFGYLTLRRGKWKDKQLISDQWVSLALTPTPAQPTYGFMNWFLNMEKKYLASAPEKAFVHIGNGTNMIYVDPDNDLVVVARWIENGAMNDFIQKVLASITK